MGTTDNPDHPDLTRGIDSAPRDQAPVYLVLSSAERALGFVRPVRVSYLHTVCGAITTMGMSIAETYARRPDFYGATYCTTCRTHRPVGADGEFVWMENGHPTDLRVGT